MTITGSFTADVPGQIAGTVNGDVSVDGKLIILKNAVVNGNVDANELEVLGSVTGDITCAGRMILQNACFVKGNISTVQIQIEKDAVVEGIITKPGDKSAEEIAGVTIEEPVETAAGPVLPAEEPVVNKVEVEEVESWF